jgi:hypothetical protein
LPGLVASTVGLSDFIGLGDWGGVSAAGLTVPSLPDYHETSVRDLVVAVLVGVVAAAVATAAKQFGAAITARAQRLGVAVPLLLGGLVLGALALGVRALGGNSQDELFSGQASLPVLAAETSVVAVVILLVAKAIGFAVSVGAGFRGGPVFRSSTRSRRAVSEPGCASLCSAESSGTKGCAVSATSTADQSRGVTSSWSTETQVVGGWHPGAGRLRVTCSPAPAGYANHEHGSGARSGPPSRCGSGSHVINSHMR